MFSDDIFTEPDFDTDVLANLGPLRPLAGAWSGVKGSDSHPVLGGAEPDAYVEHTILDVIDPQTNGPQLFYGLRYHTHVTKPGETETFHDQVGYWLWEPATHAVLLTIGIPRGQVVLAGGSAAPDATTWTVSARLGDPHFGIVSNPFLDHAFHTVSYEMTVTVNSPDEWAYEQDTVLEVRGTDAPFHHTDHNTLTRLGPPTPNPMAAGSP